MSERSLPAPGRAGKVTATNQTNSNEVKKLERTNSSGGSGTKPPNLAPNSASSSHSTSSSIDKSSSSSQHTPNSSIDKSSAPPSGAVNNLGMIAKIAALQGNLGLKSPSNAGTAGTATNAGGASSNHSHNKSETSTSSKSEVISPLSPLPSPTPPTQQHTGSGPPPLNIVSPSSANSIVITSTKGASHASSPSISSVPPSRAAPISNAAGTATPPPLPSSLASPSSTTHSGVLPPPLPSSLVSPSSAASVSSVSPPPLPVTHATPPPLPQNLLSPERANSFGSSSVSSGTTTTSSSTSTSTPVSHAGSRRPSFGSPASTPAAASSSAASTSSSASSTTTSTGLSTTTSPLPRHDDQHHHNTSTSRGTMPPPLPAGYNTINGKLPSRSPPMLAATTFKDPLDEKDGGKFALSEIASSSSASSSSSSSLSTTTMSLNLTSSNMNYQTFPTIEIINGSNSSSATIPAGASSTTSTDCTEENTTITVDSVPEGSDNENEDGFTPIRYVYVPATGSPTPGSPVIAATSTTANTGTSNPSSVTSSPSVSSTAAPSTTSTTSTTSTSSLPPPLPSDFVLPPAPITSIDESIDPGFPAEERLKRYNLRKKVVEEVLSTEQSYVSSLNTLQQVYIKHLSDDKILTQSQIETLFSNIGVLQPFQESFLSSLNEIIDKWAPGNQEIGKLFVRFSPFFKMYTQYINNYDYAARLLTKLTESSSFTNYVKKLNEKNPGLLDILSFLIMPVQRIPRYKLLLAEIIRFTNPEHVDYQQLQKAMQSISIVAQHINESIRSQQTTQQMLALQEKFIQPNNSNSSNKNTDNPDSSHGHHNDDDHHHANSNPNSVTLIGANTNGVIGNRRLVKHGPLTKKGRFKDQNYEFFLFSDLFLYAEIKHTGIASITGSSNASVTDENVRYKLHRKIFINNEFSVSDVPDYNTHVSSDSSSNPPGETNCIQILSAQKSFIIYSSSAKEKQEWLAAFVEVVNEFRKATCENAANGGTGGNSTLGSPTPSGVGGLNRMLSTSSLHSPLNSSSSTTGTNTNGTITFTASAGVIEFGAQQPVFEQFKSNSTCNICKTKCSFTSGRYHCRACGCIVCNNCARDRIYLAWTKEESRVCSKCTQRMKDEKTAKIALAAGPPPQIVLPQMVGVTKHLLPGLGSVTTPSSAAAGAAAAPPPPIPPRPAIPPKPKNLLNTPSAAATAAALAAASPAAGSTPSATGATTSTPAASNEKRLSWNNPTATAVPGVVTATAAGAASPQLRASPNSNSSNSNSTVGGASATNDPTKKQPPQRRTRSQHGVSGSDIQVSSEAEDRLDGAGGEDDWDEVLQSSAPTPRSRLSFSEAAEAEDRVGEGMMTVAKSPIAGPPPVVRSASHGTLTALAAASPRVLQTSPTAQQQQPSSQHLHPTQLRSISPQPSLAQQQQHQQHTPHHHHHHSSHSHPAQSKYVTLCRALYTWPTSDATQLPLTAGDILGVLERDQDWWRGEVVPASAVAPSDKSTPKSRIGLFPSTFILDLYSLTNPAEAVYEALGTYKPDESETGHLPFSLGDLLIVRQKHSNGWWQMFHPISQQTGWAPSNFIHVHTAWPGLSKAQEELLERIRNPVVVIPPVSPSPPPRGSEQHHLASPSSATSTDGGLATPPPVPNRPAFKSQPSPSPQHSNAGSTQSTPSVTPRVSIVGEKPIQVSSTQHTHTQMRIGSTLPGHMSAITTRASSFSVTSRPSSSSQQHHNQHSSNMTSAPLTPHSGQSSSSSLTSQSPPGSARTTTATVSLHPARTQRSNSVSSGIAQLSSSDNKRSIMDMLAVFFSLRPSKADLTKLMVEKHIIPAE